MTDHALDLYGDASRDHLGCTLPLGERRCAHLVPICRVAVGWLNEHAN
jgi:hypothetical protein